MLNKVELEGKVLSAWIAKGGAFLMKVACSYKHRIGDEVITEEKVFRPIFNNKERIPLLDVVAGDKVKVTGHLHLNHKESATGCTHDYLQFYADDIEIVSFAKI